MENLTNDYASSIWPQIILLSLILWTIPWKAVALWKSARNNDLLWFIILMIVNTLGILEILYIFLFSKKISKK